MTERGGEGGSEKLRVVARSAPRGGFFIPAVFSALPLMLLFIVLNGSASAEAAHVASRLAFYVYLAALPVVVAGIYNAYQVAAEASRLCGARLEYSYLAVAVLPGLYAAVVGYTISALSRCSDSRLRRGAPFLDAVLALATAGLHSVIAALSLERLLSLLAEPEAGREAEE